MRGSARFGPVCRRVTAKTFIDIGQQCVRGRVKVKEEKLESAISIPFVPRGLQ